MSNIPALRTELTTDPETLGYSGQDDATALATLNAVNRNRNRESMTGDEIFEATATAEWAALTADDKQLWMSFCGRESLDPFGGANVALVQNLFGGGSTTVSNLQSLRVEQISRAEELGLGKLTITDIKDSRA